ncbi:MAG: AMP-binding protein [Paludibacteraceae bacterium]|nr:AMP-binding protein [Paludibacteraceae bacterium]MBQ8713654.1 AMP-binding protein [Prevotella sp.]
MDLNEFLAEWQNDSQTVLVHTSGSTGKPKPLLVEKRRMEASARITCRFLGLKEGDTALLCMPLDYIAGKMMVVRALTCGMRLVSVEPKGCPEWDGPVDFAAMVPLQVWNLLQQAPQRLQQIRHLIIGGGAINEELAAALKDLPNAVWSTYGMTETLSHIALRRLNGPERSDWYTPFGGVEVSLNEEDCLVINAPAVHDGLLVTNDIAELSPLTSFPSFARLPVAFHPSPQKFRILGRKDNVICSGGIKIQIEEVERLLHPHLHEPYIITKAPDTKLGEQVVLLTEAHDLLPVQDICRQVLPKYWQPRKYLSVDHLPMTETGKPARAEAERLVTR